jgi:hypothetical protein
MLAKKKVLLTDQDAAMPAPLKRFFQEPFTGYASGIYCPSSVHN